MLEEGEEEAKDEDENDVKRRNIGRRKRKR